MRRPAAKRERRVIAPPSLHSAEAQGWAPALARRPRALATRLALLATCVVVGCATEPPAPTVANAGPDRLHHVGEEVAFDTPVGQEATWYFGDGERQRAEGPVTHRYERPGHFVASIVLGDGRSGLTDTALQTVVHPPLAQAPLRARTLLWDDTTEVLAVAEDFEGLFRWDPVGGGLTFDSVPGCSQPTSVARGADGGIWLACWGSDSLAHGVDGTWTFSTLGPGDRPRALLLREDGELLVTLEGAGELLRRAPSGDLRRLPLGFKPAGLAVLGDTAFVTRLRSTDGQGLVLRLDLRDDAMLSIPLAPDPGPDSDTTSRGVPNWLVVVAPSPDGRRLWLPALSANTARGRFRDGQPLTHETTARAVLRAVDLAGAEPADDLQGSKRFDDRDRAADLALSPAGDWLYALHMGAQRVDVLDAATLDVVYSVPGLGVGATAVTASPDGRDLAVLSEFSRELVLLRGEGDGARFRPPERTSLLDAADEPLAAAVLRGKQLFHDASDPRITLDAYLSCASCHLRGEHDGLTWDFTDRGEGLRNTTSLLGGGGRVPLHWSANFDEVQDFENDIRLAMAGAGLLSEEDWARTRPTLGEPKAGLSADLDALAAYVESLGAPPSSPPAEDAEARLRGESLFLDPGRRCIECHPPPYYTDSAIGPGGPLLHDVGTLGPASGSRMGGPLLGLDTPTLLGLSSTAPYLHDGSALTLEGIFAGRNTLDQHGRTTDLSASDLADLALYLRTIQPD